MTRLIDSLRSAPPASFAGLAVVSVADYRDGTVRGIDGSAKGKLDLPSSNVLQFTLEGGSKVTVRPSGTEPKIKFYASVAFDPEPDLDSVRRRAAELLAKIEKELDGLIG
jgi:phosphoglucomutase